MSAVTLRQRRRSALIYERLAQFSVYRITVPIEFRSIHNICFDLLGQSVQVFLAEANASGLFGLKGHKKVGGIRISLTHGVSAEGFNQLLTFLDDFGRRYSE